MHQHKSQQRDASETVSFHATVQQHWHPYKQVSRRDASNIKLNTQTGVSFCTMDAVVSTKARSIRGEQEVLSHIHLIHGRRGLLEPSI